MDKSKHKNVKYANETKFNQYKNKWTFHDSVKFNDVYEVILNKKSIKTECTTANWLLCI